MITRGKLDFIISTQKKFAYLRFAVLFYNERCKLCFFKVTVLYVK